LVDFNLGYASESTGIGLLQGNYRDFDTNWYFNVGAKITMAMLSNSLSPIFSKMADPIVNGLLRCILDRGCNKHLLKLRNLPEDRKPKKTGEEEEEEEGEEGEDDDVQNSGGEDEELNEP